jgi:Mitochondrial carrier protein
MLTPGSNVAGIRSLWSGLSASILRQTTYSTARFALYDVLARNWQRRNGGKLSAGSTIACAGIAGGLAGMIGNPTEVVDLTPEILMCLTHQLPDSSRPDVCRRREGTSSKISLPERHSWADQNRERRRLQKFHKGLRPKCCEEYLDE